MYRIEGDGSYNHTKIWRDDEIVDEWYKCVIVISSDDTCTAALDNEYAGYLDRIVINGIYKIIGDGKYTNTAVFIEDQFVHGVQYLEVNITKGEHSRIYIDAILLPNKVVDNA